MMNCRDDFADKAKGVVSGIKDAPVTDAIETVCIRASRAGGDAFHGGRSIIQRMNNEHGYSRDELWNLGDSVTDRIAKYMRRVACMPYHDVDVEYLKRLMTYADDIGNRIDDVGMLHDMALIAPFESVAKGDGEPSSSNRLTVIDDAVRERNERFMTAWRWVGRNMMTERYVRPIRKDIGHDALSKVVSLVHDTVDRATDSVDAIDTDRFPVGECLRIADMLHEFVTYNIGYEDGYSESDHQLKGRDDEWADMSAGFWYVRVCSKDGRATDDAFTDAGHGTRKVRSNREVGLDYCAYCEDIDYASTVFEAWGDWMSRHPSDIPVTASLAMVGDRLRDEFVRCWDWLGENAMSLWW